MRLGAVVEDVATGDVWCWDRQWPAAIEKAGDDDHKIGGDGDKCCNQYPPVLETADTSVGRPAAAGVQDIGATVTMLEIPARFFFAGPKVFVCWNQLQILLPSIWVFIGPNQKFLLPCLFPCWNQCIFLLQLSSIFPGTNQFFCFHVFFCWNHCITFATTVLIFCYYCLVDLLHPFFHEVTETHNYVFFAATIVDFCYHRCRYLLLSRPCE